VLAQRRCPSAALAQVFVQIVQKALSVTDVLKAGLNDLRYNVQSEGDWQTPSE
jgi:hypothetical protein